MGTMEIHIKSVFFVPYRCSTENSNIYFLLKLLYRSFKMALFLFNTFDKFLLGSTFIRHFTHRIMRTNHLIHSISPWN